MIVMPKYSLFFLFICASIVFPATCRPNQAFAVLPPSLPAELEEYINYLQSSTRSNLIFPQGLCKSQKKFHARFRLSIKPDGQLNKVTMVKSSGNADFDLATLGSISKTFPVAPFPAGFDRDDLHVVLDFSYMDIKNCKDHQYMKEKPRHEQQ